MRNWGSEVEGSEGNRVVVGGRDNGQNGGDEGQMQRGLLMYACTVVEEKEDLKRKGRISTYIHQGNVELTNRVVPRFN